MARSMMRRVFGATGLVLVLLLVACDGGGHEATRAMLPWQIERLPDGYSRVFGIEPGRSSLLQAAKSLGQHYELALFVNPDQTATLEAFYSEVTLAGLSAKIVLTLELSQHDAMEMRQRAVSHEKLESGEEKLSLAPQDAIRARNSVVTAIGYIPYADLNEALVSARFGKAEQRVEDPAGKVHFLYPDKGLDLLLDDDGKELLQYVAPREFSRLRKPLQPRVNG